MGLGRPVPCPGSQAMRFGTLNQARYGPRYRMVDRSRRPPLGPLSGTSEGVMPATSGISVVAAPARRGRLGLAASDLLAANLAANAPRDGGLGAPLRTIS